jgi:HK97 gp10 family phage protein
MAYSTDFRFIWNGTSVAAQLQAAIEAAMEETAEAMAATAQSRAPVRTGFLRDSIHAEAETTASGSQVTLSADADYALFVEMGTSRAHAQPYLRPAIDAEGPRLPDRIRSHLGSVA